MTTPLTPETEAGRALLRLDLAPHYSMVEAVLAIEAEARERRERVDPDNVTPDLIEEALRRKPPGQRAGEAVLDALRLVRRERVDPDLRAAVTTLISYALAPPTNEASAEHRDSAIAKAKAILDTATRDASPEHDDPDWPHVPDHNDIAARFGTAGLRATRDASPEPLDVERLNEPGTEGEFGRAAWPHRWLLRLICCGRDDGSQVLATYTEADAFRASYVAAEGHDRAAIIEETGPSVRLGYHDPAADPTTPRPR